MAETLQPNGTESCNWVGRNPSQVDGNCHLNVDEGMVTKSSVDNITASGLGKVFELQFPQTTIEGEIAVIKAAFYYAGTTYDNVPGAEFQWFLDGSAITTAKDVRMQTAGVDTTGQLTWEGSEITYSGTLTGLIWNAAAKRTLRITTIDGGALGGTPGPWVQEDEG